MALKDDDCTVCQESLKGRRFEVCPHCSRGLCASCRRGLRKSGRSQRCPTCRNALDESDSDSSQECEVLEVRAPRARAVFFPFVPTTPLPIPPPPAHADPPSPPQRWIPARTPIEKLNLKKKRSYYRCSKCEQVYSDEVVSQDKKRLQGHHTGHCPTRKRRAPSRPAFTAGGSTEI